MDRELLGLDDLGNVDAETELSIELVIQQVKKEYAYIKKYGMPKNKSEFFKMYDKAEEQKLNCKIVKDLFKKIDNEEQVFFEKHYIYK